jgi:phosphatidylserine decarboxylase
MPMIFVAPVFGLVLIASGTFTLWFFRDPPRQPPSSGILAPADGRISVLRREGGRLRLGMFMNVTDVHVNRAPVDGVISTVEHTPGSHLPAFTKESDRNERASIVVEHSPGLGYPPTEFEVILIAGAVARRITPYVERGDSLQRGQRIAHIAFGSRADIVLPTDFDVSDILVSRGDRVRAGETVLATEP